MNNFENIINRRVDISEDIQRFQKTLQYARSKVDYAVAEYVYLLPSDMNLRIGKIRRYNNKILIASPSFKIGTNLKINLNGEQAKLKDEPEVKSKEVDNRRLMVKSEPDVIELDKRRLNVKPKVKTKPNIEPNKKHEQDVKPNIEFHGESKPDTNKITYEEEKVALILGITSIFTVWWILK